MHVLLYDVLLYDVQSSGVRHASGATHANGPFPRDRQTLPSWQSASLEHGHALGCEASARHALNPSNDATATPASGDAPDP
jgi:hypothetical protein